MPIYEYECSSCKFYSEILQKISDAPLKKCPSCGKSTMKKLISAPVFRLKGSGWYETDFKSDQESKRNLADRDEPAEKADTGTTPGKPADKAADNGGAKKKPAGKKTPAGKAKPARRAAARKKAAKRRSR